VERAVLPRFGGDGTSPDRGKKKEMTMSKPMSKTQLVAALAEEMGADRKTAGAALDAIAALVAKEVAAGGAVNLPGLGKVACRARPERQVRNPATGETLTKPADKQVKFAIAKSLKDSVNV
jgi:DNA-binding protein HU-beta